MPFIIVSEHPGERTQKTVMSSKAESSGIQSSACTKSKMSDYGVRCPTRIGHVASASIESSEYEALTLSTRIRGHSRLHVYSISISILPSLLVPFVHCLHSPG